MQMPSSSPSWDSLSGATYKACHLASLGLFAAFITLGSDAPVSHSYLGLVSWSNMVCCPFC